MQLRYWPQQRTPYLIIQPGDHVDVVIATAQIERAVIDFGGEDYLVLALPPRNGEDAQPSLYTEEVVRTLMENLPCPA